MTINKKVMVMGTAGDNKQKGNGDGHVEDGW